MRYLPLTRQALIVAIYSFIRLTKLTLMKLLEELGQKEIGDKVRNKEALKLPA